MDRKRRKHGARAGRAGAYTVRGHIWIEGEEGAFLGLGRITLLERIMEHGSITAAARSIGMSYRRAWELVESMNRQAGAPLVTASTGGKGGGGALLTEAGRRAVREFKRMDEGFRKFRQRETVKMKAFGGKKP